MSIEDNVAVMNYNMDPYGDKENYYPKFISLVLRYVDKLDICRYLDFNNQAEFSFTLDNFTDSLKRIFVEFKYSDNIRPLETFEFLISFGENKLSIPLEKMRCKALSNISEICFVIHPDDVKEKAGTFKVGEIEIR